MISIINVIDFYISNKGRYITDMGKSYVWEIIDMDEDYYYTKTNCRLLDGIPAVCSVIFRWYPKNQFMPYSGPVL